MIPARGRALVGALAFIGATVVWGLAGASPASAYVCGFGVDSPASGSVSSSSTVRLRGPFEVKEGLVPEPRLLEVTFTSAPGPLPEPVSRSGDAIGTEGRYEVPLGPLARNGRYAVRMKATHGGTPVASCAEELGPEQRDTERTVEASFSVSVKASPPTNVRVAFNSGPRTAVVRWDKSGDPDVAGYTVNRKVGSGAPTSVSVGSDPLSWTDSKLPATDATITYSVQAVRNGAGPGTLSEPSDAVAATALKVPAPSANTTAPPGTVATGPGTTVPFVLGPPIGDPLPTAPVPPAPPADGGYVPLDVYEVEDQPVIGSDPAVVGRRDGGEGESIPQLAFIASGLLSTVVAAHVLWLRRQALEPAGVAGTRATPLEPLEPVTAGEAPPPPEPPPEPTGASTFEPPVAAAAAGAAVAAGPGVAAGSRPASVGRPVILVPPRHAPAPPAAPEQGRASAAGERRPLRADRGEPTVISEPPEAPPASSTPVDAAAPVEPTAPPATATELGDKPVLILRPRRPEPP